MRVVLIILFLLLIGCTGIDENNEELVKTACYAAATRNCEPIENNVTTIAKCCEKFDKCC